jgi:small subunit ribosomal protein S8
MYTDPIADFLTRVRNAQMAEHKVVDVPASNMKKSITKILHDKGYILDYKFEDTTNNQGNIKIALKYNTQTKLPAIKKLIRISKPGLRKYADSTTLPRVINGLGIAILSTSKGVITDKEARNFNIGGEVICHVY